jgi:hypothetical protein
METVNILRLLWRRRVLVGCVVAVAVGVGLALSYSFTLPPQSRQYEVGQAGGRILVDTPDSQVVDIAPKGSETLGARASVLAALMTEGEAKAAIAKRAGLEPDQLQGYSESVAASQPASSPPPDGPDINLLTTRVVRDADGVQLPIIEFEAQAPNPAAAAKLASAAVAGLRDHLDSKAAGEEIAHDRRLSVSALGIEPAGLSRRGPGRMVAVGAALFVLLGGCVLIVVFSGLSSAWREAEASDRLGPDAALSSDDPFDGPAPDAAPEIVPGESGVTAARARDAEQPFAPADPLPR